MTVRTLTISATATSIAEIITLPICTVKTNYQNTHSVSIRDTIRAIYRNGGWTSFYSASPMALTSQVISTSTKYTFYTAFCNAKVITFKNVYLNKICNGMASGILSSLITHPIDVVKIFWQMRVSNSAITDASAKNHGGVRERFMIEYKKMGMGLFYRGYSKSFTKVCIGSSLYLPLYDIVNSKCNNGFIASFISAIISTTIVHPIDHLKTRQIYGFSGFGPLTLGTGITISPLRESTSFDPKIYYKGLTLNLARVVPHFVIVMTVIDLLSKRI